ncbi:MAG: transcriptional repressor [Dehalococcoidia bacterium]
MRINRNVALSIENRPVTAQRQLLLDILHKSQKHLDAKELYRQASEKDPRISLATVYRNLRLFKEVGLVEEIRLDELHCHYEMKRSTEHYHLICTTCGRVMEFKSPLVTKIAAEMKRGRQFHVTRAVLYVEGSCRQCNARDKTG